MPDKVVDFLGVKEGDEVGFVIDTERNYAVIAKSTNFPSLTVGGEQATLGAHRTVEDQRKKRNKGAVKNEPI